MFGSFFVSGSDWLFLVNMITHLCAVILRFTTGVLFLFLWHITSKVSIQIPWADDIQKSKIAVSATPRSSGPPLFTIAKYSPDKYRVDYNRSILALELDLYYGIIRIVPTIVVMNKRCYLSMVEWKTDQPTWKQPEIRNSAGRPRPIRTANLPIQ